MAKDAFHSAGRNDGRLYRAVVCGDRETVIEELRQGDLDPDLSIGGRTLLHHAGERGFKEIARLLIGYGADQNVTYGKRGRSLLHFAAATGNYGFASVLLECEAKPTPRANNMATPLHFAARSGQGFLAALLYNYGAEINARDTLGRTPLHLAMAKSHIALAKQLIGANGNPEIRDRHGNTARRVAEAMGVEL